jgi:hypothetical protein
MNTARRKRGLLGFKGHNAQAKGTTLVESLRLDGSLMIRRWRLVLVIGGQESQNYSKRTVRLKSTQIRWFS